MKRISYIILLAATALAFCGCQNELEPDMEVSAISFNPSVGSAGHSETTKAAALCSADGGVEIPLWLSVSDGISVMPDSDPVSPAPETKGTLINTGSADAALSGFATQIGSKFYVTGWKGTTPARFIPASGTYDTVSYSSNAWTTSATYSWDGSDSRTFYAYANLPSSGASVSNTAATSQTLTYSAVPASASAQKDILMGYYSGTGTKNTTDKTCSADIMFHHPLTAVKFVKGDFDGITSVKFKAIYLSQIHKSGTATMTPTSVAATDPGNRFSWSSLSTEMQEAYQESTTDLLNSSTNVIGEPFIIIPQNLANKPVTITIVAEIDGVLTALTTTCSTGSWKAGYTNTYSLSKDGYKWDYTFSFEQSGYTFESNKSANESRNFNIRSIRTRRDDNSVVEAADWVIKSYKIGNSSPVTVNGTSISSTDCWAYTASAPTIGKKDDVLRITAAKAEKVQCGSNDFWCNSDDRTYDLDWSPAHWTGGSAIDLSKMDYTQDDRSLAVDAHSMTTSNCYIIRHAGTYKLPLVYGNARKNGSENTASYCSEGIDSNPNRLARFVNHLDRGITSSFIENNEGCIANSCDIIWQSDGPVLSDLEILGNEPSSAGGFTESNVRYLQFKVDPLTVQQTNALIAIKDDQDRIIWSWHIWVTNNPDVVGDPIKVTNYRNKNYYFLGVNNIGDITTSKYLSRDEVVITLEQKGSGNTVDVTLKQFDFIPEGNGLIYEYGRKDPFPSKDTDYAGNTILTFYNDGSTATTIEEVEEESAKRSIGRWIQSPDVYAGGITLYKNSTVLARCYWSGTVYSNLWTGLEAGDKIEEISDNTVKTIYDPSPAGYQIPMIGAFSGFDLSEGQEHPGNAYPEEKWNVVSTNWDNGYTMWTSLGPGNSVNTQGGTIKFRGDGMRAYATGKWLKDRGTYYSATCDFEGTSPNIFYFMFQSKAFSAYQSTTSLENGATVRPIKEKS